jgi:hypothetical protein
MKGVIRKFSVRNLVLKFRVRDLNLLSIDLNLNLGLEI